MATGAFRILNTTRQANTSNQPTQTTMRKAEKTRSEPFGKHFYFMGHEGLKMCCHSKLNRICFAFLTHYSLLIVFVFKRL